MKKTLLALAVSTLVTSGAFALNATDIPDIDLWISGSSAQDWGFYKTIVTAAGFPSSWGGMCADTPIIFTDTAGVYPGVDYSAYFCTMDESKVTGLSGTKKVMIHKRSEGGSAWGVGPVALAGVAGQSISRVDVKQMQISFGTGNGTFNNNCHQDTEAPFDDGFHYVCSKAVTDNRLSDAGISDVEPQMFAGFPNLIPVGSDYDTVAGDAGTSPLSASALAKLSINPMSAMTFGIVVTKDLRDALQQAQGKTVGSDAVDQMPSLTSIQIRSLFTGAIYDWSQFNALDPMSGIWKPLTDGAFHTSVLADTHVNICRLDPGSGMQALFNAHFLGAPCDGSAALTPLADNSSSSSHVKIGGLVQSDVAARDDGSPGTAIVHEMSTSGDVTQCLTELETTPTTGSANGKFWGIGIQVVTSANKNFRFVAIDGVAPTLNNVASSKYFYWGANTLQYRSQVETGAVGVVLSGDKLKIVQKLTTKLSMPAMVDGNVNKANPNITGVTKVGALALSSLGFVPNIPYDATHYPPGPLPVLPISTKDYDMGSSPNTCRKATLDGQNGVNLEILSPSTN